MWACHVQGASCSVVLHAGLGIGQLTLGSSHRRIEFTGNVVDGVASRLSLGSFVLYRQALMENIGDLLLQHGFVMLRASPRSGKTSILDLCCAAVAAGRSKFHSATYFSCTKLRDAPTFEQAFKGATEKEWKAITGGDLASAPQICIS